MTEAKQKSKPGDRMSDGTIFAGISPRTHKRMYTTPEDAPGGYDDFLRRDNQSCRHYDYFRSKNYAENLAAHDHKDWRVPSKGELKVLFNHRAAIGGFSCPPATLYWSSSRLPKSRSFAWGQSFVDGQQVRCCNDWAGALRCVRG